MPIRPVTSIDFDIQAPTDSVWISTDNFARAAQISSQAAGKALRRGMQGYPWRESQLQVRRAPVRGGKAGLGYKVRLDSLPVELRSLITKEGLGEHLTTGRAFDPQTITFRLSAIDEALDQKQGSADRRRAIERVAEATGKSSRTLYRWISRYETSGVRGLSRKTPANAGKRRVSVSRQFDHAFENAGLPHSQLAEIAGDLDIALKGLWASRAEQAGANEIRHLAEFLLVEICEKRCVDLPQSAFKLSRRRVERFAEFRVVNQRRNDRKAFDDAKPRIRRDWTGLAPMERVVADVKHLDIIVSREDGTIAWPKIVAFMDAGTGRAFVYPLLPKRGESVRQEHVIEAFLAMVADPEWGFPQGLYLDNGSEFAVLAKIDSALQQLNDPGARTIIYARPYNASAKPIESLFARLDRQVFSLIPGYAGPDRMAAKTQTAGKPPAPYPGSWDEFRSDVLQLIDAHNRRPVGGQWAGRSPHQWLQDKLADGWRRATVDLLALDAAFSDTESRRVDRGVIKLNGARYTHAKLAALPSRTAVDVAVPWRRGATPLAKVSGAWIHLQPDRPYPARWIEGAKETGRRQTAQVQHVRELARQMPMVDPVAIKIRWAERERALDRGATVQPGPKLDLGNSLEERASHASADKAQSIAAPSEAERRRARERAITERLERQQNADQ